MAHGGPQGGVLPIGGAGLNNSANTAGGVGFVVPLQVGSDEHCSSLSRHSLKLSVDLTCQLYLLEIEGIFTQGS